MFACSNKLKEVVHIADYQYIKVSKSNIKILRVMHNLHTNFSKILANVKDLLKAKIDNFGNFYSYSNKPKMSDSEIVALAITAEMLSISSEKHLIEKLKSDYKQQFPNLITRPRYNVRRRKLQEFINELNDIICNKIAKPKQALIVDSAPLEIAQSVRGKRSKVCKDNPEVLPHAGYCASQKKYYYGFKIQLFANEQGLPISWGLQSANTHDIYGLDMFEDVCNDLNIKDIELIGDKGYLSKARQLSLFESLKVKLITPFRKNMDLRKCLWTDEHSQKRKRIETMFSQLIDQFNLRKHYAKKLDGLMARISSKITAFAMCQYFNFINNKPLNEIKYSILN
jgi:hypothetical protein